jgi:hypothetical protein
VGRLTGVAHDFAGTAQDVTFGYGYNPAAQIVSRTISNDLYTYAQPTESVGCTPNGLNQYIAVAGAAVTHDERAGDRPVRPRLRSARAALPDRRRGDHADAPRRGDADRRS